ncbi:MAG: ASCH domain-containing protein [Pseudomonadota bacterium]
MVAYSFKKQFIEPIASGRKLQTVRGLRKRHARPGEALQLYTAMRTKHCRKILQPDPICCGVDDIWMWIEDRSDELIKAITVNSIPLDDEGIEAFAIADGFGGALADGFARRRMGEFWIESHADGALGFEFEGVVVRWTWNA